jgi:tRNA/tmRNA/rRNA uracil-C5-methylase (TrmA/RlmC/RlmD family)
MTYDDEARAREAALREYWRSLRLPGTLRPLIRSPLGRHYRTTSKRKTLETRHDVRLALIDPSERGSGRGIDIGACGIEPATHAAIFRRIQEAMQKPFARPLVAALRYVIIRGNYSASTVIFNVAEIDGPLVKSANTLSKGLTHDLPDVKGVMLFEDTGDGRYYLGTRNPSMRSGVRKIFGDTNVYARYGGKSFLWPALSFSQINGALVDGLIEAATRLLGPNSSTSFYDLYCGYGLFTLTVGLGAKSAVGIERSVESVEAAVANAKRQHATGVRFVRSDISADTIAATVSGIREGDLVLLDPARAGTGPGIIETLAARRPGRVVHLFCNVDILGNELDRWKKSGYRIEEVIPFDMFPGTDELELMVLFLPS